jgi:hypothetical protein
VVAAQQAFRLAFEHKQVAVGVARRRATAAVTVARAALVALVDHNKVNKGLMVICYVSLRQHDKKEGANLH